MSSIDLQKMKKLLALELPQVAVASALGCSEGYVAQCMADGSFAAEVSALRIARLEGAGDRDVKLDKLEDLLLDKMEKSLALMFKPSEVLNAFKIINGAKRSTAVTADNGAGGHLAQQVTVVLPQVLAINYVQNHQGEIIEAGGRSLATLPSNVLKQMAAKQQQVQLPNRSTQIVGVLNDAQQTDAATPRRTEAYAGIKTTSSEQAEAKAA